VDISIVCCVEIPRKCYLPWSCRCVCTQDHIINTYSEFREIMQNNATCDKFVQHKEDDDSYEEFDMIQVQYTRVKRNTEKPRKSVRILQTDFSSCPLRFEPPSLLGPVHAPFRNAVHTGNINESTTRIETHPCQIQVILSDNRPSRQALVVSLSNA